MLEHRDAAAATGRLISASDEEGAVTASAPEMIADSPSTPNAKCGPGRRIEPVTGVGAAPSREWLPQKRADHRLEGAKKFTFVDGYGVFRITDAHPAAVAGGERYPASSEIDEEFEGVHTSNSSALSPSARTRSASAVLLYT